MYIKRPRVRINQNILQEDTISLPSQPVNGTDQSIQEYDTKKLIQDAYGPEVWKQHLEQNLMKFWNMEEAKEFQGGLFPTYRTNQGTLLPENPKDWPKEFCAALEDPTTKGLIEPEYNFVRAHSRQTYAYGIAFHMTGKDEYLKLCRKGALALVDAMDGNYGMHVTQEVKTKQWDTKRMKRTSQDLAYGLTGIGMYYFLTHDPGMLHKIVQLKDYIFKWYFDEGRGYITWYPKYTKDSDVEIVAQLDQLYAYMLMLTPIMPEPYKTEWKKDLKMIAEILIETFYSERYGFFWGVNKSSNDLTLGTDHTDFGHSVKTFWVILKIGEILKDPFYIDFARQRIDQILQEAYIEETGTWARRYDVNGKLDTDKEWWILAELDQACEILALNDPSYLEYLNNTQKYWLEKMVDHDYGEIWHMVSGEDNKPMIQYPKMHSWKTSLHSFEHALFSYMTASRIKNIEFSLYYAPPEWERVSHRTVAPYMFRGNVTDIMRGDKISFMPDGNHKYRISFNGLH